LPQPFADLQPINSLRGLSLRPGKVRKLREFINEHQPGPADPDFIERPEPTFTPHRFPVHVSPVQAPGVANKPPLPVRKHFRVFPATEIILEGNLVRGCAAKRVPHPRVERVDIAESIVTASDKERCWGLRHGA
jgi:hypothetical protein